MTVWPRPKRPSGAVASANGNVPCRRNSWVACWARTRPAAWGGVRFRVCGRGTAVFLALVLPTSWIALPSHDAAASEQAENSPGPGIRTTPERIARPLQKVDRPSRSMWVWHEGRRAFNFTHSGNGPNSTSSYGSMGMMDLDTGLSAYVDLPPRQPGWSTLNESGQADNAQWTSGMPHVGTVDQETGTLFAAYTLNDARDGPSQLTSGQGCAISQPVTLKFACLGGYHIVDGRTLEVVAQLPLSTLRVDGVGVAVIPRATGFVPASGGGAGKLIALVMEAADDPQGVTRDGYTYGSLELSRNFVVQWDVASRRQEWSLHLPQCRGAREGSPKLHTDGRVRPNPGAVFAAGDGRAIWVACTADYSQAGAMVHIPMDAEGFPVSEAKAPRLSRAPDPAAPMDLSPEVAEAYRGPERVAEFYADAASERVLMRVLQNKPDGELWYVFDGVRREYLGVIGTGKGAAQKQVRGGSVGIDPTSGRFYVLQEEGLYVADLRRTPLAQALFLPGVPPDARTMFGYPLVIDSGSPKAPRRILYPVDNEYYGVLEDDLPVSSDAEADTQRRTFDLPEIPGTTQAVWDGAARGYGARVLLIGGIEAAARWRFVDAVGQARGFYDYLHETLLSKQERAPRRDPCLNEDREVVLGFVGPTSAAVVDATGARGTAVPVVLDGATVADLDKPVSRCTRNDWEQLWTTALFGRPPVAEPGVPVSLLPAEAECLEGPGEERKHKSATSGDPSGPFHAQVRCGEDEAGGFGYARGGAPGLNVAEAVSSFRIYRDPGRGVVSRVESAARGIAVADVLRIQSVRGVAESWANGALRL